MSPDPTRTRQQAAAGADWEQGQECLPRLPAPERAQMLPSTREAFSNDRRTEEPTVPEPSLGGTYVAPHLRAAAPSAQKEAAWGATVSGPNSGELLIQKMPEMMSVTPPPPPASG